MGIFMDTYTPIKELYDPKVDVAMALVFIVALGEMCKALSFQSPGQTSAGRSRSN